MTLIQEVPGCSGASCAPRTSYSQHKSEQSFYSGSLHIEAFEDQRAGIDGKMKEDILKLSDSFLPTQGRNGSVYILEPRLFARPFSLVCPGDIALPCWLCQMAWFH